MASAWIVDGRGIATKVKNASLSSPLHIKDCGASIKCPNCTYLINNSNVSESPSLSPWPGLPKGVKFDPTDEDIIDFLEAKCGIGGSQPHILLDEFIRTVTEDVGINYTHPKNLPGANKDGVSIFFFHKTVQAYGTGQRKRRKITPTCLNEEPVRWHKTGRTKLVFLNGMQRGCKKIMVLYKSAVNGSKPEKSNWVMHQYHLGTQGNEIGDYVVSKITYQQEKKVGEIHNEGEGGGGPRTPPRPVDDTKMVDPFAEDVLGKMRSKKEDDFVVNLSEEDNLTCYETIEASCSSFWENPNPTMEDLDLENADLGSPPDFLTLPSQESLLNWIGWL